MFARIIAMLVFVAIAVNATAAAPQFAQIPAGHVAVLSEMSHGSDKVDHSYHDKRHSGSADANQCELACASLTAFLTMPGEDEGPALEQVSHDLPAASIHTSQTPGLNEHPPKLRLL
jgi:hypothetical protein